MLWLHLSDKVPGWQPIGVFLFMAVDRGGRGNSDQLFGAWSLVMVPVAYADASRKATNRPLCIAAHSPIEKEVSSFAGLRGLAFYTTLSGYKMGDTWYFHGLLVVDGQDGIEVYHWSPRRMGFQELEEPQRMIATPLGACRPRPGFLQALSVI